MSNQQTTTRGKRSTAQKMNSSRHGYNPIPATSKVAGAFGERERTTQHAAEVAMHHAEQERNRARQEDEASNNETSNNEARDDVTAESKNEKSS